METERVKKVFGMRLLHNRYPKMIYMVCNNERRLNSSVSSHEMTVHFQSQCLLAQFCIFAMYLVHTIHVKGEIRSVESLARVSRHLKRNRTGPKTAAALLSGFNHTVRMGCCEMSDTKFTDLHRVLLY